MKSYSKIIAYPLIAAILILSSCGPAAKLRRAEKLIAKAEELGAKWRVDSVIMRVPVHIDHVRVDTVERVLPGDSILIEKDRLKVVIKRLPGDTIKVQAECLADTVEVEVTKTVTKTIEAKSGIPWWWLVLAGLVGAGFVAILRRR